MKKNNGKNRNLYDFDLENEKKKKNKSVKSKHSKENEKKIEKMERAKKKKQKELERKERQCKKNINTNKKVHKEEKTFSKIDPDNEIIIGVTKYPDAKKEQVKNNIKTKDKKNKKQKQHKSNTNISRETSDSKELYKMQTKEARNKKGKKLAQILKWTSLAIVVAGTIAFAMLSPMFNISKILVQGNEEATTSEIIGLAEIETGANIFRINKKEIENKIKQNGYVEDISIKRILPATIELTIKEREASFIIQYGSGYVYINNQGYILEISNIKKQIPIILGIKTPNEQFVEANRLEEVDLRKLGNVLKIMSVAQVNDIANLITTIDISDDNDYKLNFESEQKEAHLGDCSDLETRILYLTAILKNESGKAGEIFVNMNLNTEDAFFREKV